MYNENELYHHGIKGQKWGVRRYQNKDGTLTAKGRKRYLGDVNEIQTKLVNKDDVVIKRGSVQSHVSGQKKIKLKDSETYIYDSNNEHDRKVYEGAYSEYLRRGKGFVKQYVHKYVTTEDLISPSEKRRVDIFIESYKKDPVKYYNEMNSVKDNFTKAKEYGYNLTKRNDEIASYNKRFDEKTSNKDLRKYGYETLSVLGEYGSSRSNAINTYYSEIKNRGYNSIVDDNNRSVYNDAVQPFISLNGKKTLKEMYSYRLTDKERNANIEDLRNYNEKKYGKRTVAL